MRKANETVYFLSDFGHFQVTLEALAKSPFAIASRGSATMKGLELTPMEAWRGGEVGGGMGGASRREVLVGRVREGTASGSSVPRLVCI